MNDCAASPVPRAARIRLALFALAAELIFVLAGLLLIAPLLLLQLTFLGPGVSFNWLMVLFVTVGFGIAHPWFAALVMLLLACMWWWSYRRSGPGGRQVARNGAPAFFCTLDALAARMGAARIDVLVLHDSPSASAYEAVGLFALFGNRRRLVLRVPLLQLLTRTELLAVVARELGHFARKRDWLGHWVCNVRCRWSFWLDVQPHGITGFERVHLTIAQALLPAFNRCAGAWSRAREYEADRLAARACGGAALAQAQALTRIAAIDGLLVNRVPQALRALQLASATAPEDYRDVVRACALQAGASSMRAALRAARMRAPDPGDTHPSLDDRLRALAVQMPDLDWDGESAGAALLDAAVWQAALQSARQHWREANDISWRFWHLYMNAVQRPEALTALAPEDVALRRLVLADWLAPTPATLAALDRHAACTGQALPLHEAGCARLQRLDATAIATIRSAIESDWRLARAGYENLFTIWPGPRKRPFGRSAALRCLSIATAMDCTSRLAFHPEWASARLPARS